MRKLIPLIFVILIIFFVQGCKNNTSGIPSDINLDIDKDVLGVSIYYPRWPQTFPSNEKIDRWQNYMNDKYSVSMNLTYIDSKVFDAISIDSSGKYGIGTDLRYIEETTGLDGLIYTSKENLLKLRDAGLIIPLNDYADDFITAFGIKSEIVNQFKDTKGNLWALPLMKNEQFNPRVYRADWLSQWGQVPGTLDEFWSYGEYIAENMHASVADFRTWTILLDLNDVFKAFGCYPDGRSPIGYNPETGDIENAIFSNNFESALLYIKTLYDEGLLMKMSNMFLDNGDFNVASSMSPQDLETFADSRFGFTLNSLVKKPLIEINESPFCFAVLRDTENTEEQLRGIQRILLTGYTGFLDMAYGIEGEDYTLTDNYVSYNDLDESGEYLNQLDILTFLIDKIPVVPIQRSQIEQYEYLESLFWNRQEAIEQVRKNMENFTSYIKPFWAYSSDINRLFPGQMEDDMHKMFQKIFDDNVPVSEALDEFRSKYDTSEYKALLKEVNGNR